MEKPVQEVETEDAANECLMDSQYL